MAEVKKRREPIPENFDTIEDFWKFWDNKSLADYDDYLKEVEFELDIKSEKNYFALEKELARKVSEIAKARGISSETLLNLWIQEKVYTE